MIEGLVRQAALIFFSKERRVRENAGQNTKKSLTY